MNAIVESKAIPLKQVRKALEILPYGSTQRVMFEMLTLTGCRLTELDNMKWSNIRNDFLYFKLGKNQKNWRKVKLPARFVQELKDYRETHRVQADALFGAKGHSFRRLFDRESRKILGSEWLEKRETWTNGEFALEYKLQLKGLRKNYQTLVFKSELEKWGDPGVALEFTSKAMRHSSTHITAYHYLVNFDSLGSGDFVVEDVLDYPAQLRLSDFF